MRRILNFLLLIIVFFTKIISAEGPKVPEDHKTPEVNYDLTINVDNNYFKIESFNTDDNKKIFEIIEYIDLKIKSIPDERFIKDNSVLENEKDKALEFKANFKIEDYDLEKFKKNGSEKDQYFLELFTNEQKYEDILVKDLKNIKTIYLIKKRENFNDSASKYEVEIEDKDIYNDKVGFKDNVVEMIKSIPFTLSFYCFDILKKILESKLKQEGYKINTGIKANKINVKIEKKDKNQDDKDFAENFYKKVNLQLKVNDKIYAPVGEDKIKEFYNDWKDKIKSITFDDIKDIFNLENIYLIGKKNSKIDINCEKYKPDPSDPTKDKDDTYNIILKYKYTIVIDNIQYKSKTGAGDVYEDICGKVTIFTDYDKISDFLYYLSSEIHYNMYEDCCTLFDELDSVIDISEDQINSLPDDGLDESVKLIKIKIDKNKLSEEYSVSYKSKEYELRFTKKEGFSTIYRLLVSEEGSFKYQLKGSNGNIYNISNNEYIPNVEEGKDKDKNGKVIKYTLEEIKREKKDYNNLFTLKTVEFKKEKSEVTPKTIEQVIEENEKLKESNKKEQDAINQNKEKKKYC